MAYGDTEIFRRHYRSQTEGTIEIMTVLVEGAVNDFAAYEGHGDPDWVKANGIKLFWDEAVRIFPQVNESNYRR